MLAIYALVAGALLLRLSLGLALSMRLRRRSRATEQEIAGIEIRESELINAPVTLGIMRPAIVLPVDWREWNRTKLDAVVAHEQSHIRRYDPAVQLLSAIHRALLWHSPLSWYLHQRLVRVGEEASDDAAVTSTNDRALYAEVLLDFLKRGGRRVSWQGCPDGPLRQPDRARPSRARREVALARSDALEHGRDSGIGVAARIPGRCGATDCLPARSRQRSD